MTDDLDALLVDLVEWVARRPRPHREVMEAWRTSCPRLPVWEEACDRGYVERVNRGEPMIVVTARGRALLAACDHTAGAQARPTMAGGRATGSASGR